MNILITVAGVLIGLLGLIFGIYQYMRRRKDEEAKIHLQHKVETEIRKQVQVEKEQSSEDKYRTVLRKHLESIRVIGTEFDKQSAPLKDTFVSLQLSETWRCETRFDKHEPGLPGHPGEQAYLTPEQVMEQTFREECRLLMIIGDPGSGKTTLLQYYAVTCLDKEHRRLGFKEKEILPLYFPLRELVFSEGRPISLADNLALWANNRYVPISPGQFTQWLNRPNALVLLDGLDEISDKEKRKEVCEWITHAWTGLNRARFVVTSRPTGFRKIEGFELECDYLRADIMDFTPQQQERFLRQWFHAVYLKEVPENAADIDREQKEKEAGDRARAIIDFLNKEENKVIRDLARVPMLLQIMAILWKDRDFLPGSRGQLYDVSLNYLLEYRDLRRKLKPVLPLEKARSVLTPTALRMLEVLKKEYVHKTDMHAWMQGVLGKMENPPAAQLFCENLRDRAGLLADYGSDHYIFRHKSFMEFLASLQLLKECWQDRKRMKKLVESFHDDWWEEPLRFFFSKSDDRVFDRFMQYFFQSEVSRDLDSGKQTLLENLVREAPLRNIDSMAQSLHSEKVDENQKRYILNCLKIIDTKESIDAVQAFLEKNKADKSNLDLAGEIVAELGGKYGLTFEKEREEKPLVTVTAPRSFRNPYEDNVEYILIPGGSYTFSVTGKEEKVRDLYFCKYPVTNKRYRNFISYLERKQETLHDILSFEVFAGKLMEFAKPVKGYSDYLGTDPRGWGQKLRSRLDENKKFNADDQPVVGVTWYAARAYCFWLSCLHAKEKEYRLPNETEWEWAAAGREPGNSLREYPWAKDKGEPTPDLANYGENVGATTPVGRYPAGATPEGLMDMAGNVWEWMENFYDKDKTAPALRGGSWGVSSVGLRCASRGGLSPVDLWDGLGFRVVSFCAPSHTR